MDWTSRTPFQWDWETLALLSGEQTEISKPALLEPKSKIGSGRGMGNGSVYSFGGVAFPSSEVGNCSSRSSISASVDSSSKAIKRIPDINFESLELDNQNKNKDFSRVDNSKTSAAVASAEGAKQSALGLKLGKRIYFEDPCVGNHTKSSSSSVSTNPSTTPVKKSRVYQQSMLSAYCQVEGCNMDLTTAKDYHRKHRVCENHSKSPKVVVAGQERRFCQQCSRFHALSEFDQKKRSCRRRLSDHNARRRKPQLETISFNSSKLSTSYYDDKQQANFAFGQSPFSQMTTMANSIWDGSGCFKLTQTEGHWMKLSKTGGINGQMCFPSNDHSNNVPTVSHDMDRLFPPKGTTAEVLNQGLEVTVAFNLDGAAPDHHQRALSLLSTDSHVSDVPSADTNKTATNAAAYHAMRTINVRKGLWQQDEQCLAQVLPPFDSKSNGGGGGQFQESLPLKTSYSFGTGGFLDSSQLG